MRRVLHVGKFYPPELGGMERVLQQLAEGLSNTARVSVLVANTTPRTVVERKDRVRVVRAARVGQAWSQPICPTLPYWLDQLPADLVMLHVPNPLAMWAHLRSRSAARSIVWIHSYVVRQWLAAPWYESLLRRCLAKAQAIAVSSPPLLTMPSLQPFRDKCHVIPYAVDPAQFAPTPERRLKAAALRERYGTPLVLFVGRLTYYKGLRDLLEAFSWLEGTLLVVGSGPQGRALKQQAQRLKVTDRVHFVGAVDHETLAACYHGCDLLVLPSVERSEAFGVVQIEAMAAAKPVISTQLPTGVPWVNQDGVTGLVVPPRSPRALARAITRLLQDADLRRRLGEQARARIEREFTTPRMIQQVTNLCEAVLRPETLGEGTPCRANTEYDTLIVS